MTLTAIKRYFDSVGCSQPEISLLQPADPFLDTTGEDLRRRIFITQDNSGSSLCLRPEFTVPVCLQHLREGNGPAKYAYGGKVFRQRQGGHSEFLQAGYEDLGRSDTAAADADCICVASDLLKSLNQSDTTLVIGHQAAFVAVLEAIEVPMVLQKRLLRAFGDAHLLSDVIEQLSGKTEIENSGIPDDIRLALTSGNETELIASIKELMIADGLPLSGGRTPESIAARLTENHKLGTARLPAEMRSVLEAYLAIDVELVDAPVSLRKIEQEHSISLDSAIEAVEKLVPAVADLESTAYFRASFGRTLDYYTGLVFEFYRDGEGKPVIGGGRYDQLLTLLGSKKEVPAVGFAIWIERLGVVT